MKKTILGNFETSAFGNFPANEANIKATSFPALSSLDIQRLIIIVHKR